jgi:tRNA pseudouridine38-40 synthase
MVDVGLGRRPADDVPRLLARTDNAETSPPAPPQGLYFVAADYPPDCFADPHEASHDARHDAHDVLTDA